MRKEKSWKQMYAAHERRMWLTGVGIPLLSTAVAVYNNPEAHDAISRVYYRAKRKVETKVNILKNKIRKE